MIDPGWEQDPKIRTALRDFEEGIRARFPDATFSIKTGGEPDGIYLFATVDLEDTGPVLDAIMDRLLEVQIDEGLPIYVLPVRPPNSAWTRKAAVSEVQAPVAG